MVITGPALISFLQSGQNKVARAAQAYNEFFGDWYDQYMQYCYDIMNSGHPDAELQFERDIASMINLAETRAPRVGYMIWDWRVQDQGLEAIDPKYKIVLPCVKQYLRKHHEKEFEQAKTECPDDHLGPTAQPLVAKLVGDWINDN